MDEVQLIPPPTPIHQPPLFIKALQSMPHYDKLKMERPCISFMSHLKCETHPSFEGLSAISNDMKSFFDELFLVEGDIFDDCYVTGHRKMRVEGLFVSAQQLEFSKYWRLLQKSFLR